ncbi:MAG: hypothetical protein ACP5M4_01340 [Acidobacteriaceae bacterium]
MLFFVSFFLSVVWFHTQAMVRGLARDYDGARTGGIERWKYYLLVRPPLSDSGKFFCLRTEKPTTAGPSGGVEIFLWRSHSDSSYTPSHPPTHLKTRRWVVPLSTSNGRLRMKRDRFFYTLAGAIFLVLIVIGFQHYIFHGRLSDNTPILPAMLVAIVAHSTAIFAWFLLFFVQALLISTRNRKIHMKLGWSVLVVATAIVLTGPIVAYSETVIEKTTVFDWPALPFLLVMLTEIFLYAVFVTIGVVYRKQPRIHRPMMLLAGLSLISGALVRIPLVNAIFGLHQWLGLFGPVTVLGGLFLLLRWAMTRRFEREYAVGYALLVAVTLMASQLAMTHAWISLAGVMVRH